MKINYRVLSYNEKDHSMTVRYWTDIISEDDLASSFDEYNKIIYTPKGYPVKTRADVNITFYNIPDPSNEDIIQHIEKSAPSLWLYNLEQTKVSNTQYNLSNVSNFVHVTDSFNIEIQSNNNTTIAKNTTTTSLKEDAAKIAIRYIKTGVYDLGNTDTYII